MALSWSLETMLAATLTTTDCIPGLSINIMKDIVFVFISVSVSGCLQRQEGSLRIPGAVVTDTSSLTCMLEIDLRSSRRAGNKYS